MIVVVVGSMKAPPLNLEGLYISYCLPRCWCYCGQSTVAMAVTHQDTPRGSSDRATDQIILESGRLNELTGSIARVPPFEYQWCSYSVFETPSFCRGREGSPSFVENQRTDQIQTTCEASQGVTGSQHHRVERCRHPTPPPQPRVVVVEVMSVWLLLESRTIRAFPEETILRDAWRHIYYY